MKKTVKEWLQELPDGYRERALKNYCFGYEKTHVKDLPSALTNSFSWLNSLEGIGFWGSVYTHLKDQNNPLPPLPDSPKQKTQKYTLEDWRKQARAFREKATYWREKAEKLESMVDTLKINEGVLKSIESNLRAEIATLNREKDAQLEKHQTDFVRLSSERNRLEIQVKDLAESLSKTTKKLDTQTAVYLDLYKENEAIETELMETKSSLGFFKILSFFLVIGFLIFCAIFLPY